jgi:hypothetical protein
VTAPLTPADCDLRDFAFMPVDVRRLLASETWITGSGEARAAAMSLWLESWHQVPAGSLPDNDRMLAHLAQCSGWKKVRDHVLRGWVKADDGRLYHPVVAEKALEAWLEKLAQRISGAEGNAKRWGMQFDRAPMEAAMQDARQRLIALNPQSRTLSKRRTSGLPKSSPPDPNPIAPRSPPDPDPSPDYMASGSQGTETGTETVKYKNPEAARIGINTIPAQAEVAARAASGDTPKPENPPPIAPTRRGALAVLLRSLGVRCTEAHPTVVEWANGLAVTDDEARSAVAMARLHKPDPEPIPIAYLVPILRDLRTDHAPSGIPAASADPNLVPRWWESEKATNEQAAKLGMRANGGEGWAEFRARIRARLEERTRVAA